MRHESMEPRHRRAFAVSVASDVGRVRHNNEDFAAADHIVVDEAGYSVWVVADGVGGGPHGEVASRMAAEAVVGCLAAGGWTDPGAALAEAFARANECVYEITGSGAAATTLVATVSSDDDGSVWIANVGDSRAYLVASDAGAPAHALTDDHSLVAARLAAGAISAEEARTAPDRNVLTRGVGSERRVTVDLFGPRRLLPGERLVLCTDGVHGMIDDAEIGRIVRGTPISAGAEALVAAAVAAGGRDNATAIVGGYAPEDEAPRR